MSRSQISARDFGRLDLRVGTVVGCRRLPTLGSLSRVSVRLEGQVEALAPSAALPPEPSGHRVIVATGLHPIHVGEETYDCCVLTATDGEKVLLVDSDTVPDGSRLY